MTAVAALELTSPVTQAAAPFILGHVFAKGDVPAGQYLALDTPSFSIVPLRTWNDGSVKHAAIIGRTALTAGVPKQVNITRSGVASSSGTPLTAASIQAAAPQAVVSCGAFGSVSLSSLLGSPRRTFISTPEMVECHYSGQVGTDAVLYANFHVRLFADGRMWVRVIVGNGYLDSPAGTQYLSKSYVPNVTIGGVTIFDNAGAAYTHSSKARYDLVGWIGTDPQVTPRHDTGYMMRSKMVPNYWRTNPSTAQVNTYKALLPYAPGKRMAWTPQQGDQGFQDAIGLMPQWDAMYFAGKGIKDLYDIVIGHARAYASFGIAYAAASNRDPIKISDFPNWSGAGLNGTGGDIAGTVSNTGEALNWEPAHFPAFYLPYLLTADYYYLETAQYNATCSYLFQSTNKGSGVNRTLGGAQNRQVAWCIRSLAHVAAIYPTSLASLYGDTALWLSNLIDARKVRYVDSSNISAFIGFEDPAINRRYSAVPAINSRNPVGQLVEATAGWEQDFNTQSLGMAADIEPLSSMGNLLAYRDYVMGNPVWRLGGTGATEFNFGYATSYTVMIPTSLASAGVYDPCPVSQLTATNGAQIFSATFSRPYQSTPTNNNSGSLQCNMESATLGVYNPSTLSTPIVLTYHKGADNITGFPSTVTMTLIDNSATTTYAVGTPVPRVNDALLEFSGIRCQFYIYTQSLANDLEQFTISATPAEASVTNPGTNVLLNNPSISSGYWANLLPAIAYAVDSGKTGASAAFNRIVGADNFATTIATAPYNDIAQWGIVPRSYSQQANTFTPVDSGGIVTTPGPSIRVDTLPLYTSGFIVTSQPGIGTPGSQFAGVVTGADGTTPIYDAKVAAGGSFNVLSEYRSVPSSFNLFVSDVDQSQVYTGSGPFEAITMTNYEDGGSIPSSTEGFGTSSDTIIPTMSGSLISSSITSTSFVLSWPAATDNIAVTGYEVSTNGGINYTNVGNVLASTQTNLAASTTYSCLVRAYDAAGNKATPLSLTVSTPTGSDTAVPTMNGVLNVINVTSSSFSLNWVAASDNVAVVYYEVSVDNGASYSNVGNVLSYSKSGLTGGVSYICKVRAVDSSGNRSSPLTSTATTNQVGIYATTVTFAVVDSTGMPVNASGLDYAFYDRPRINAGFAPVKVGSDLVIVNGVAVVNITGSTTLFPGNTGRIEWGDAGGTKHGGGPVTVT